MVDPMTKLLHAHGTRTADISPCTHSSIAAILALLTLCLAGTAPAAQLRVVGVLGNSGESGEILVTFLGDKASGIGPVLDNSDTIWERAGARQLNRYALDGRLLASTEARIGETAEAIKEGIIGDIRRFVGDRPLLDDIVLLVVKRLETPA